MKAQKRNKYMIIEVRSMLTFSRKGNEQTNRNGPQGFGVHFNLGSAYRSGLMS